MWGLVDTPKEEPDMLHMTGRLFVYELPWLSHYLELKVDRSNQDQFLS